MATRETTPQGSAREPSDVRTTPIVTVLVTLLAMVGVVVGVVRSCDAARPEGRTVPIFVIPPPVVQVDPVDDYAQFVAREKENLDTTRWEDRTRGVVAVPPARARELYLALGAEGWQQVMAESP